jgi:hypothetical protein
MFPEKPPKILLTSFASGTNSIVQIAVLEAGVLAGVQTIATLCPAATATVFTKSVPEVAAVEMVVVNAFVDPSWYKAKV